MRSSGRAFGTPLDSGVRPLSLAHAANRSFAMDSSLSHLPTRIAWLCLFGGVGTWRILHGVGARDTSSVLIGIAAILFGVRAFVQPLLFNQQAFSQPPGERAIGPRSLRFVIEVLAVC